MKVCAFILTLLDKLTQLDFNTRNFYVALGVDTQGIKDVLGIWIDTTESASKWCEIFEELKDRGIEDIFFASMDGLSGLPEAVEKVFPQAIMQRC